MTTSSQTTPTLFQIVTLRAQSRVLAFEMGMALPQVGLLDRFDDLAVAATQLEPKT